MSRVLSAFFHRSLAILKVLDKGNTDHHRTQHQDESRIELTGWVENGVIVVEHVADTFQVDA